MVDLYIKGADGAVHRRSYEEQQITIGRKRDNLVVLDDLNVSHRHALLEQRGDAWVIIDRRSTNGTRLGDLTLVPDEPTVVGANATIFIGPYEITLEADLDRTVVTKRVAQLSADDIAHELAATYACLHDASPDERNKRLRDALAAHRARLRNEELFAGLLSQVVAKFATAAEAAAGDGRTPRVTGEEFYVAAHRALTRLSEDALGRAERFSVADDVERFGALLGAFVSATADWIVRCCGVRKDIQEAFGTEIIRLSHARGALESITTPQDVTGFALDWTAADRKPDDVAAALNAVFQAFVAQHAAVLKGAKAVADAVLLSLSPTTIQAKAAASPGGGFRIFNAAKSPLWLAYLQEWNRLSEPGRVDAEIVGPKMKEACREMEAKPKEEQS
jgi:hypothetical protein